MPIPQCQSPAIAAEGGNNKVDPPVPSSQYSQEKELGHGTFGKVFQVFCHKTFTSLAMKVIKNVTEGQKHNNGEEISLLKMIVKRGFNQCNLLKYFDSFESELTISIVTEKLDISIDEFIFEKRQKPLEVESVRKIGYQIINGIKHLNLLGYAHTDLKSENIMLVDRNGTDPLAIKIIDFGASYSLKRLQRTSGESMTTICTRSPEVLCDLPLDEKIDVWSIGVILFELYTALPLFTANTEWQLLMQMDEIIGIEEYMEEGYKFDNLADIHLTKSEVTQREYRIKIPPGAEMPPAIYYNQRGFRKLHKYGLNARLGSGATKEDRRFSHLIHSLLKMNPFERFSIEEAMEHDFMQPESNSLGAIRTPTRPATTQPTSPYSITRRKGLKMTLKMVK